MKKCDIFILLASVILLSVAITAQARMSKEQVYSLFSQANGAFSKANEKNTDSAQTEKLYEQAILSYEKIIKDGQIENAKLYYNLANAYFLKRDIGRAILNYRRAENLDSDNTDIQKNLAFARNRRIDQVKVKTEKRILQTLFFWHYDFSVRTRFLLSSVCVGIICISCTIMIWLGRRAWTMIIAVIATILLVGLASSVAVDVQTKGRVCGVIIAAEVVAYQGDGQNYPVSFKEPLHAGMEFDLIQRRGDWFHIRLSDNSQGWIRDTSAELI